MHRAPPENANATPWEGGVAGRKHNNAQQEDSLAPNGIQSWFDVDHRTAQLTAVADYRDQLLVRLGWAGLKLELSIFVDDFDDIVSEAAEFSDVCSALSAPSVARGSPA